MKVLTVEYRRLRTFGHFENETIGATAEVGDGDPENALANLREWVDGQIGNVDERSELQNAITELRWKKESLERQFEAAGNRWEAVLAFMKKLGVERPADLPETLEELPF